MNATLTETAEHSFILTTATERIHEPYFRRLLFPVHSKSCCLCDPQLLLCSVQKQNSAVFQTCRESKLDAVTNRNAHLCHQRRGAESKQGTKLLSKTLPGLVTLQRRSGPRGNLFMEFSHSTLGDISLQILRSRLILKISLEVFSVI